MFQKFKRIALVVLTTVILTTAAAATASAATVQATGNINLRAKASTSSRILTVMKKNTKRTVIGVSKNKKWYKVKVNGKTGYVNCKYVKYSNSNSGSSSTKTESSGQKKVKLGNFKLTFYGGDTMTASGKRPRIKHTIAVDRRVIPLGSKVYIEGMGTYYAEDTGGAIKGNILDVFVRTEAEANQLGIRYADVYLYK